MATSNEIYVKLSEKIGVVGYPRYIEILKREMTPEEAELAVDLAGGKSLKQLTEKMKIDEKSLNAKIEDLVNRRFVRKSALGDYAIPQMPRFFPRFNHTPELKRLWYDFFHSGDYFEIDVNHMKARAKQKNGFRSHKIIPARQALLASPNISPKHILWYEDMEQIFRRAKSITQGGFKKETGTLETSGEGCGCRRYWGTCGAPGGCTGWEWKEGEWGQGATQGLPFGGRNVVSVDQALAACNEMEDFGLIHLSPNTAQITSTCNCCECCCEIVHGFKKLAEAARAYPHNYDE